MCQSAAEGGTRCANHTRPDYENFMSQAETKPPSYLRDRLLMNDEAVIAHAATPKGEEELLDDINRLAHAYHQQMLAEPVGSAKDTAMYRDACEVDAGLRRALHEGQNRRRTNEIVRKAMRKRDKTGIIGAILNSDPAITGTINLAARPYEPGDQISGFTVADVSEHCNYCGGKNVPLIDTSEGRRPVPHVRDGKSTACQWGTDIGRASIANTSNLL